MSVYFPGLSIPRNAGAGPARITAASFNHKTTLPSGQWHMISVTINQPKTGDPAIKIQKGAAQPGP